jgi:hypothetical protein
MLCGHGKNGIDLLKQMIVRYHINLMAISLSSLSFEGVFLERGAKPPNKAQNSPASASAINFPSSRREI